MTPSTFATLEGFDSQEARKKRLGQYFSGLPVSKLLVALAARRGIRSVCDPMGGRGDMLIAAREVIAGCKRTDGIEIDPIAHGDGIAALRAGDVESTYLFGSAFDAATVSGLAADGYDLVATNPPYVRYQSQKESAGQSAKLPSALEVRNGLRECLTKLVTLTAQDRDHFLRLAEGYSGLSDLAVPSWILCAGLVKPGGTLAMVVPEAWLNRDYANVVRYLLLRWFRIEYIVEDAHAAWFADAQVKTTLLVARRIDRLDCIDEWSDETYLHVSLPSRLATSESLVGRCALDAKQPELAFSRQARRVATGASPELVDGATWHRVRLADQVAAVTRSALREPWFKQLEPHASAATLAPYVVPPVLVPWFVGYEHLTTLGELGVEIGQGLRTGANGFYYANVVSRKGPETVVASSLLGGEHVALPMDCALPVVRRQADVAGTMSVEPSRLTGAALAFHGWALPEDASVAAAKPLPRQAADYVRRAAGAKVGGKALPSLTAVAPNGRKPNPRTGAPARFWYMLPDFAPRHRPDLFIARVNSETPRVTLNPGRKALVDANFSTLWMKPGAPVDKLAVFAYLNSSVAAALFEHTGAVMGGGALKLEATHLRSLPVPALSLDEWGRLAGLGAKLVQSAAGKRASVVRKIDETLCRAMFGAEHSATKVMVLHAAIEHKQAARAKSHDASTRSSSTNMP
jgi:hypothetical protein